MAATDIVSVERAKQALDLSPADVRKSDVLATAITAVSQLIDDVAGPIVHRTVTDVLDSPPGTRLHLTLAPVASITSVKVYDSGTLETLTAETLTTAGGYLADLHNRIDPDRTTARASQVLRRRSSWSDQSWDQGTRIEVVYVAGRYATTAACAGSRFELAAMLALKSSWRAWEQSAVQVAPGEFVVPAGFFPSFTLPDAALELIARDRVHVVGMA